MNKKKKEQELSPFKAIIYIFGAIGGAILGIFAGMIDFTRKKKF